ncbi:MAG: long-chain fatty acid transport protein [Saprospiraceae bacterium]|jgi:long-chain fatty acid transport protein
MKNSMKIVTAISTVLISTTALGVTGLDRAVFSPSILFEEGNVGEITFARSSPTVSPTFAPAANVAHTVDTVRLGYKHQLSDKFDLGFMINTQPVGVDLDYKALGSPLRGSVSARSSIALGHFKATNRISAFGGIKHQQQKGNADLTPNMVPGATTFGEDSDTGFIVGAAYSIPKIAFRASLTYESDLAFSHKTTNSDPRGAGVISFLGGGNTTSGTAETLTLDIQSGIAKNTLLFASVREAKWSDAQVKFLGITQLSDFHDTTDYKLGIGRKINDSISVSITANYEASTGKPVSPFSPQDGEKGIALGGKFTAASGLVTSVGVQYRKLGDATTTAASGSIPFTGSDVVTMGIKFSKSF